MSNSHAELSFLNKLSIWVKISLTGCKTITICTWVKDIHFSDLRGVNLTILTPCCLSGLNMHTRLYYHLPYAASYHIFIMTYSSRTYFDVFGSDMIIQMTFTEFLNLPSAISSSKLKRKKNMSCFIALKTKTSLLG